MFSLIRTILNLWRADDETRNDPLTAGSSLDEESKNLSRRLFGGLIVLIIIVWVLLHWF